VKLFSNIEYQPNEPVFGGYNYMVWLQISSEIWIPKIMKICQFLTELF